MNQYINVFIDEIYPDFFDKYYQTKTLQRILDVTQFCGCDYTGMYSPLFLYTRFYHCLVVAHQTWHFTHNKKEAIMALLHDTGTPCFAHCIDYVFGDYLKQESSEKRISEVVREDTQILDFLREDGISVEELDDYSDFHILENKSPRLCTDRLDGVLHTCYIWLHTHTLDEIREVYDNMAVLQNEDKEPEIGFNDLEVAEKFVDMVNVYARELRGNTDKYVMKYISEIVKLSVNKKLITLDDLYSKKESEICDIFASNFASWSEFVYATDLIRTNDKPEDRFYISFDTKKRNTIPLVRTDDGAKRIVDVSLKAFNCYEELDRYKDSKYAYVKKIKNL